LRIVDPPRLRVLGFREDGPFFTFLVPIRIPFGNGKLAQERTGACSKANRDKHFSDHAVPLRQRLRSTDLCCGASFGDRALLRI
jgi:hypothetical protein